MKVWAVVKTDYEEFTTEYICSRMSIAQNMANLLNERNRFFRTPDTEPNTDEYPKYVVLEHELLDKVIDPPFPKYVSITVNYNPSAGSNIRDRLQFDWPSARSFDEMTYYDDDLPYWAKNIIVRVSIWSDFDPASDTLDLEFGMYIPISKTDSVDNIKARGVELIMSALKQLDERGYNLSLLTHGDVTKFDDSLWDINKYGGKDPWYIAITKFPNPLMADVKIADMPEEDS